MQLHAIQRNGSLPCKLPMSLNLFRSLNTERVTVQNSRPDRPACLSYISRGQPDSKSLSLRTRPCRLVLLLSNTHNAGVQSLDTMASQLQSLSLNVAGLVEVLGNACDNIRQAVFPNHRVPFQQDIVGKTYLVTGGNSGVGKATAQMLAASHAGHVIVTSRSEARAKEAASEIKSAASGSECKVRVFIALQLLM